jgi:acetylornithine deacetylase/succinyl-diaminopimelate desuccinylase-like protein
MKTFDFIELARRMVSFDTSPQSSTVELVQFLSDVSTDMGLFPEIQKESQQGVPQANIIIRTQPPKPGEQNLLLQAHLDTVDPGSFALWKKNQSNPFDAVIDEGHIHGLGVAEVKLDFLCKLFALHNVSKKNKSFQTLNPVLVGTYGEETGMQGALKIIRKNKINTRYAIISEPSNLQIINAAKGFVTVEIRIPFSQDELNLKQLHSESSEASSQSKVFSGKATHSSTPHLGENAAVKMFEYLSSLPADSMILDIEAGSRFNMVPHQASVEISQEPKLKDAVVQKLNKIYQLVQSVEQDMKQHLDDDFTPNHSTLSIGVVRLFEDYILVGGSCRIVPSVGQDVYEKWIKMFYSSCEEIGAEFHLQDYKRAFRLSSKSILVKSAQNEMEKLGIKSECRTMASANEASLFSRTGIECICIGIGEREGNIHTPDEKVSLQQIETATSFYEKMIERLCD